MELRKNWRKLTTALSRFWHRKAGPMNWKNPVRVVAYIGWEIFNGAAFLVGEWVRYGVRAGQIFLAIPPTVILFFGGGGWFAVWSFVRRPFPALETVPLLDLLEYHNPNFYSWPGLLSCRFGRFGLRRESAMPLWFGTTFLRW